MSIKPVRSDASEGDVEAQIILPLLQRPEYLSILAEQIKSKKYLAPTPIDKGAGKRSGYYPDFLVYCEAFPICVVEAKAPDVTAESGYREAGLYALDINKRFPTGVNPCAIIIATNGIDLLAGTWDAAPSIACKISDLQIGSKVLSELIDLAGRQKIEAIGVEASNSISSSTFRTASSRGPATAMIFSKVESNTFAAELSPILRQYFSSHNDASDPEIYKRSYVSSDEVTSYDKDLESFLKDRVARSRAQIQIATTKSSEPILSKALAQHDTARPLDGALQLITGGVGSGKSLFARRYKELLQPSDLADKNHWSFIDFNTAPNGLNDRESWTCEQFVKGLVREGAPINLLDADDQERIFSTNIEERKSFYDRVSKTDPARGQLEMARDIEAWRTNPRDSAFAVARYLQGDRRENLVVVFDNVDKLDALDQLSVFQTALWFMSQTRAFVILQLRDVTFETYKGRPPLDTYRSGRIFHVSPPKFVDVAKKRLELSLERIEAEAPEEIKYTLPSGVVIRYPKRRAGDFLRAIYTEVFDPALNIARVIEALSDRDVREALNMFLAVLTSGHMPEDLITRTAQGLPGGRISETKLIRILMRTDYRFYNPRGGGFVKNIFHCDPKWERPSNFLVIEILFFLLMNRQTAGDNGQMGYFSIAKIQDELEKMGHLRGDTLAACVYALENRLIEADTLSLTNLRAADCVKATASAWAHMRVLSDRIEYVHSVLPTTALSDDKLRDYVFDRMEVENSNGELTEWQALALAEDFLEYLKAQRQKFEAFPGYANGQSGAAYIISKLENVTLATRSPQVKRPPLDEPFDF